MRKIPVGGTAIFTAVFGLMATPAAWATGGVGDDNVVKVSAAAAAGASAVSGDTTALATGGYGGGATINGGPTKVGGAVALSATQPPAIGGGNTVLMAGDCIPDGATAKVGNRTLFLGYREAFVVASQGNAEALNAGLGGFFSGFLGAGGSRGTTAPAPLTGRVQCVAAVEGVQSPMPPVVRMDPVTVTETRSAPTPAVRTKPVTWRGPTHNFCAGVKDGQSVTLTGPDGKQVTYTCKHFTRNQQVIDPTGGTPLQVTATATAAPALQNAAPVAATAP